MTLESLKKRFEDFFEAEEWPVEIESGSDDTFSIDTGITLDGRYKKCDLRFLAEEDVITSIAYFNVSAEDDECCMELMKFVTMLNFYRMRYHRIELDINDGSLRVTYDIDIEGQETISDEVLTYFVFGPSRVIQSYSSYFLDIAFGNSTAEEAWEELCQDDTEDGNAVESDQTESSEPAEEEVSTEISEEDVFDVKNIEFAPLAEEDIGACADLFLRTYGEESYMEDVTGEDIERYYKFSLTSSLYRGYVGKIDGRVAAVGSFFVLPTPYGADAAQAYMDEFYVEDEAHRAEIEGAFLEYVTEELKPLGANCIFTCEDKAAPAFEAHVANDFLYGDEITDMVKGL